MGVGFRGCLGGLGKGEGGGVERGGGGVYLNLDGLGALCGVCVAGSTMALRCSGVGNVVFVFYFLAFWVYSRCSLSQFSLHKQGVQLSYQEGQPMAVSQAGNPPLVTHETSAKGNRNVETVFNL